MGIKTFLKDPDAVLDYEMDWSDWLVDTDTIVTSTWTADTGITIDSNTNSTTSATVWLSGGAAGSSYTVTNSIVTDDGRADDRSITIRCSER